MQFLLSFQKLRNGVLVFIEPVSTFPLFKSKNILRNIRYFIPKVISGICVIERRDISYVFLKNFQSVRIF